MSNIPPEIVAEFLSRLPAKCLLRFRCVSKPWCEIIDSADFIKMHLNRTLQTSSDRKLILQSSLNDAPLYLHWADFVELEKTNKAVYTEFGNRRRCDIGNNILGSCHGLLCLEIPCHRNIVLWNPTTGKSLGLPGFEFVRSWWDNFGFGYDSVSDDYKVLRIFRSYDGCENKAEVFSIKSNSWRKIPCFPYHLTYKRTPGVLAAGALHWVVNRDPGSHLENLIAAFDLSTEEYRLVPEPNYSKEIVNVNVNVLGESLCAVCNYLRSYIDIWVMKNYAVKESWTKLFTIVVPSGYRFHGIWHVTVTPIAYSKSGKEVLVFMVGKEDKKLFWCDLEKRKIRSSTFCISTMPDMMKHEMCFGSLVQLDGVLPLEAVLGGW